MELLNYVNNLDTIYNTLPETIGRARVIMKEQHLVPLDLHQDMVIETIRKRYYLGMRFTEWQLQETVLLFIKVRDEINS